MVAPAPARSGAASSASDVELAQLSAAIRDQIKAIKGLTWSVWAMIAVTAALIVLTLLGALLPSSFPLFLDAGAFFLRHGLEIVQVPLVPLVCGPVAVHAVSAAGVEVAPAVFVPSLLLRVVEPLDVLLRDGHEVSVDGVGDRFRELLCGPIYVY